MEARQQLNELLDQSAELLAQVNPVEVCSNFNKATSLRPGLLVSSFVHLRSFGPEINNIVEPPSSDEASEPELFPPTMKVIVDSLLDSNMACITVRDR